MARPASSTGRSTITSPSCWARTALAPGRGKSGKAKPGRKGAGRPAPDREKERELRQNATSAETHSARLLERRNALDQALSDPSAAELKLARLPRADLARLRAECDAELSVAEAAWLEAVEALEAIAA